MVSFAGGWPATTVAQAKAGALITSRSLSAISMGPRARPRPCRRGHARRRGLVRRGRRGEGSGNRWPTLMNRALLALLGSFTVASALGESPEPARLRITTWNLEWFPNGSAHVATPEVQT
jgi:hypothetical protein